MRPIALSAALVALLMGGTSAQSPPSRDTARDTARDTPADRTSEGQPPPSPSEEAAAPPPADDEQRPVAVFRTETNYVEVDVVALDEDGNIVPDLTRDDFEIFEGRGRGRERQTISAFANVSIPVARTETTLFDDRPLPRDVAMNEGGIDGRIFVMVLDDQHTHALRSPLVKQAAKAFIRDHMGDNDVAAVVFTGGRSDHAQEFTGNKLLLEQAVDRFMGRKIRSATLERLEAYNRQRGMEPPADEESGSGSSTSSRSGRGIQDPADFERAYHARTAMRTLENVAKYLADIQGRRKTLLFFSEGIDYDTLDVMGDIQRNASDVLYAMKDAIGAATRNNVVFNTIDPRGLVAMLGESIEMTAPPDDPAYGIGPQSMMAEVRRAQDSLRTLAEETGGVAVVSTNDFATAYDRIVQENSHYYLLGYYPGNERRDGRFRPIEVRVNRPGVKVLARKGYVAPRGRGDDRPPETPATEDTLDEVRELLGSPLYEGGLALGVTAAAFKGEDDKASVAVTVQVPGNAVPFRDEDGLAVNDVEVSLIAIDQDAKVQGGDRVVIEPRLRPQTHELVQLTGFRLVRMLELPPGRYQLRVGAREAEQGTRGSVFYDLDVPDFTKKQLAMSGILLTSQAAGLTLTPAFDDQVKALMETPPTVSRLFVAGDVLTAYAEVYDPVKTEHRVAVTAVVTSLDGRDVFRATDERSSAELQDAGAGFGHTVDIPLTDVEPGLYVLRIGAKPTIGDDEVWRELSFEVVAPPEMTRTEEGADPDAEYVPETSPGSAVPFANFAFGPLSNRAEPEQVVIRSDAEWARVWASLPTTQPLPEVDFEQEMLVGVFLGERPTGGYTVEIAQVQHEEDGIIVFYREVAPASESAAAEQVTSPFVVARVVKVEGTVEFEQVEGAGTSQ